MKHIHILGICGTFMGSLAVMARQLGFRVSGCDEGVYPPMSTYLQAQDIEVWQGYEVERLQAAAPDQIVVGNAMKRANPVIEWLLESRQPLISGPAWLHEHILSHKTVLAVAGTHGKTSTSSMLAWILTQAGLNPGFLIGGLPENFGVSSCVTDSDYFVIEADEYDTAFFDKRSKFIHYCPTVCVLNNLEFDHADIFRDLEDIQRQFAHLLKIIPATGQIVVNQNDAALQQVIASGCLTPVTTFNGAQANWQYRLIEHDGSVFEVLYAGQVLGQVQWNCIGEFNVQNALAAIAAAQCVGVDPRQALSALTTFAGVKRRLQKRGEVRGIVVYDDFAHHPTAIEATLQSAKAHIGGRGRVVAVLEPRSNTIKMGYHGLALPQSLQAADACFLLQPPGQGWDLQQGCKQARLSAQVFTCVEDLLVALHHELQSGDHVVIMSNGDFGHIHERLLVSLKQDQVLPA